MKRLLVVALATLTVPGCALFFDDGDDCSYGGGAAEPAIDPGLRNPETGRCEYFGGGGGDVCGDYGGPSADQEPGLGALPDWGLCQSECTGLDEQSCQDAAGCRAAYVSDCPANADCDGVTYAFFECWQVSQSGPIQGTCDGLDAWECSRHDDCVAQHFAGTDCEDAAGDQPTIPCEGRVDPDAIGRFERCAAEQPREITCYAEVLCDSLPPECPANAVPGIQGGCWSGTCVLADQCEQPASCGQVSVEAACIAAAACQPLYEGSGCSCDASGVCSCDEWLYQRCDGA